jgi:hypothetical protein
LREERGHVSQEFLGTNPKRIFCFVGAEFYVVREAVLYGSVQSIVQQAGRARKSRQLAARISRQPFQCFLLVKGAVLLLSVQQRFWHGFRGAGKGKSIQLYGFSGHGNQGRFWDSFGAVRYFSLGWKLCNCC